MLERVEEKYGSKLPKKVIPSTRATTWATSNVRFRYADSTEGEATADGKVIVHYDKKGKIAALEITDITAL